MNRSPLRRCLDMFLLGALLVSLGAAAGCQSYREGSARTVGEFTDDVGIQARVKLALLNDPEISGLRINTEVKRGVVSLYGRVGSQDLKQRALALAAGIKGVTRVEDRLTVVEE